MLVLGRPGPVPRSPVRRTATPGLPHLQTAMAAYLGYNSLCLLVSCLVQNPRARALTEQPSTEQGLFGQCVVQSSFARVSTRALLGQPTTTHTFFFFFPPPPFFPRTEI